MICLSSLLKISKMMVLMPFQDKHGHKVLFLFEEEDDAERYAMMLEIEEEQSNVYCRS